VSSKALRKGSAARATNDTRWIYVSLVAFSHRTAVEVVGQRRASRRRTQGARSSSRGRASRRAFGDENRDAGHVPRRRLCPETRDFAERAPTYGRGSKISLIRRAETINPDSRRSLRHRRACARPSRGRHCGRDGLDPTHAKVPERRAARRPCRMSARPVRARAIARAFVAAGRSGWLEGGRSPLPTPRRAAQDSAAHARRETRARLRRRHAAACDGK